MIEQLVPINRLGETKTAYIRPLKPLVYNFFISNMPNPQQSTIQFNQFFSSNHSFMSQRINQTESTSFRPTLNCRKLYNQPKFMLSVQRKKIKIINGANQKTHSQKPSRNSYRGSKLRAKTYREKFNDEKLDATNQKSKINKTISLQPSFRVTPSKSKPPHLHFNLQHVLQKRKTFKSQFSRSEHIQGTNFPYYNYFSSGKSVLSPNKQVIKSKRLQHKDKQKKQRLPNQIHFSKNLQFS